MQERDTLQVSSEAQWLDLRREDITSTMVPALFGLSPYTTVFELYQAKANGLELPFNSNDRVEKGQRMEAYAAQEVALATGWDVVPFKDYCRIKSERMGSSFDCVATKPNGSRGILEIKAVDYFRHRDLWVDDQAPEHIEIQLQHQLECADEFEWGAIAAFTGVYDFQMYERERDHDMGKALRIKVAEFWSMVDEQQEPEPDFARDLDIIAAMNRSLREQPVDMTEDEEFDALCARFERWGVSEKEAKKEKDAAKAELLYCLSDAPKAFGERYRVTSGWTKDTPDRTCEPGEIIKGRGGYRQCLVKSIT